MPEQMQVTKLNIMLLLIYIHSFISKVICWKEGRS